MGTRACLRIRRRSVLRQERPARRPCLRHPPGLRPLDLLCEQPFIDRRRKALATKPDDGGTIGLTRRELEILRLAAEGHSNSQLARMLWVTEQTVKFHLSNIYRKLNVANRTEASRWAQRNGILAAETA